MHQFLKSISDETAQKICGELYPHLKADPVDLDMAKHLLVEVVQERRATIAELRKIASQVTAK